MPSDIEELEKKLIEFASKNDAIWKKEINLWLDTFINDPIPIPSEIQEMLLTKAHGAQLQALSLPIRYLPDNDLCDPSRSIIFPNVDDVQMHHIFPRKWISSNDGKAAFFGTKVGNADAIKLLQECLANKTPLTKTSNILWSADSPETALTNHVNKPNNIKGTAVWTERFITNQTYDNLKNDLCVTFLNTRAEEIEKWLTKQCKIN